MPARPGRDTKDIVIMNKNIMEFANFDEGVPQSGVERPPIRFEISFDRFGLNARYSLESHKDGTFSAWYNNKVIMAGTREECVQALRKRGIQIE